MFKKGWKGLNKRKVKVFLLFLLCSFLAWFLSNLSEPYESRANFVLNYKNLPDTLLLGNNAVNRIEAKIKTSGFKFLYYNFTNKRIDIDLSGIINRNGSYILTEDAVKKQMERQLSQSISLIDLDRRELKVDLYQVASKEIPIKANLDIQFRQNYILEGEPLINPTTVLVKGPKNEIDALTEIHTSEIELTDVSSDFSKDVLLVFPKTLDNSIFSINRASVSGKVAKFSEEVFDVPVQVVNFPEGYDVKTFPNAIKILCKATIGQLKVISANDFLVVADYKQRNNANDNVIFLEITKKPEKVHGVRLLENKINFVLERK
ncbi:YbbR-like domain-containing protein [Flagellimonas hymeniacidonis]|uniref:YbbR-like domain-containing protein n=1 Tax=Flagellimonas hymeniacidonis TaxID=2603628 RepID=A0A5C8V259_9FLAO|nr:YbbR-like domain-containing protein [Flagellimonas hymeniacidonis]TXN35456.1 YbbR-like domain-containing protein [Flagellimonas hymeniacidonis]